MGLKSGWGMKCPMAYKSWTLVKPWRQTVNRTRVCLFGRLGHVAKAEADDFYVFNFCLLSKVGLRVRVAKIVREAVPKLLRIHLVGLSDDPKIIPFYCLQAKKKVF